MLLKRWRNRTKRKMKATSFWCLCFILSAIITFASSAPPPQTEGNPHPFYESPFPVEIGETEGLDEPLHSQVLKRNPAPPEDCTICCQDMWCAYITTQCRCYPQWNVGP